MEEYLYLKIKGSHLSLVSEKDLDLNEIFVKNYKIGEMVKVDEYYLVKIKASVTGYSVPFTKRQIEEMSKSLKFGKMATSLVKEK